MPDVVPQVAPQAPPAPPATPDQPSPLDSVLRQLAGGPDDVVTRWARKMLAGDRQERSAGGQGT